MRSRASNQRSMLRFRLSPFKISLFLLILVFIGCGIFFEYVKIRLLRERRNGLSVQLNAFSQENKRLEEELNRLKTDLVYVEKRAREKMKVSKEGEVIYELD